MSVRYYVLAAALVGAVAAAQVPGPDPAASPGSGKPATLVPDITAGSDPMNRKPDPAEGTAAALGRPQERKGDAADTKCRVERADTDTGFVVVCE